jgi:hypothetical protein
MPEMQGASNVMFLPGLLLIVLGFIWILVSEMALDQTGKKSK